jgi:[protein-PII] uridylyltransferase
MNPRAQHLKAELAAVRDGALRLHREGADSFRVLEAMASGVDGILCGLVSQVASDADGHVAMIATGGYGRRELCPQSDVDLLFVHDKGFRGDGTERLVRLLWDGGVQLGHAVRTPEECYEYMLGDLTTANTMLEARFLKGSETLWQAFLSRAVHRYRRRHRDAFIAQKIELLRRSIEDPQRTIYVIEPNLKEGVCCLRDVQRVLWIENMRRGAAGGFDGLLSDPRFSPDEVGRLRDAYAFYLRVRCELHFANCVRQDILERDSVLSIGRSLGYGRGVGDQETVERLMGDYYRHARNVWRFLRYYLETEAEGRGLLRRFLDRFKTEFIPPHLAVHEGRLHLARDWNVRAPVPTDAPVEFTIGVFLLAQARKLRLSEGLCEWIRRESSHLLEGALASADAIRSFRLLLQRGTNVGSLLKVMHDTGFLGRILPEFAELTCLVNFDGHHQFTVDEHTLKTLEELDRMAEAPDYPEADFRRIYGEIRDPLPLRVALLLHDTGKSLPGGNHSVTGTEAATIVCERLGLDEKVTQEVDFLVYRHLELFRISELRDFNEAGVIEALAKLVGTEERLKMLYILTYIDIVSVGPGTWTRWKGAQLSELYQKTLIHLRTGATVGEDLEVILGSSKFGEADRAAILDHCRKIGDPSYINWTLPERMLYHVRLVEEFFAKRETQVALESHVGYHEITFSCADRPRLFADLTGLLYSEGFNVLGARIYSRSDGVAIDLFQVEVADAVQVGVPERAERIRRKLRKIEARTETVEGFIRQRSVIGGRRPWRKPLFGPSVTFHNDSSPTSTVIEVSAGDRPGLLYDLAHAIHRLGLDLRTAKVSTLMDRAHDAFYVVEKDGGKVTNPARRTEISETLVAQAQSPAPALSQGQAFRRG